MKLRIEVENTEHIIAEIDEDHIEKAIKIAKEDGIHPHADGEYTIFQLAEIAYYNSHYRELNREYYDSNIVDVEEQEE